MTKPGAQVEKFLPFNINVARGMSGFDSMLKFGHNPDIDTASDPEDVWSYGGDYTFSSVATSYYISSSSTADSQDILIQCLTEDGDEDWNIENTVVTLDGRTKVVIPFASGDLPIRFYRGFNSNGTNLVGNVYIYEDDTLTLGVPDTATKVRGMISIGDNQTEMAIYTIPSNKVGYFLQGYVQMANSRASFANFTYAVRVFEGVFRTQGRASCNSNGSNSWQYLYAIPPKLPAKTDVIITCEEVGANDTAVAAGFDILLEDLI